MSERLSLRQALGENVIMIGILLLLLLVTFMFARIENHIDKVDSQLNSMQKRVRVLEIKSDEHVLGSQQEQEAVPAQDGTNTPGSGASSTTSGRTAAQRTTSAATPAPASASSTAATASQAAQTSEPKDTTSDLPKSCVLGIVCL